MTVVVSVVVVVMVVVVIKALADLNVWEQANAEANGTHTAKTSPASMVKRDFERDIVVTTSNIQSLERLIWSHTDTHTDSKTGTQIRRHICRQTDTQTHRQQEGQRQTQKKET